MMVQGDDNLMFHSRTMVPWARLWSKMGFQAEPFYRDSIFDLNFCSARLLPVADGVILSPNPVRVWMKFGVFAEWNIDNDISQVVSGSALGNMINLYHIPGMAAYFKQYITTSMRPRVEPWEIWLKHKHTPTTLTLFYLDKYNLKWTSDWTETAYTEMKCELNTDAPTLWFKPLKFVARGTDQYTCKAGEPDLDRLGRSVSTTTIIRPHSFEEVLGAVELNPQEVWTGWLPEFLRNRFSNIFKRRANVTTQSAVTKTVRR